jgi:hypothetical protein
MANSDTSYPKIPEGNWWKVRGLFKKKVPAAVTASYLATALVMAESSAKANLISPFKKIGIIAEDGKPTDLAYDWRDDGKYPEVCQKLIEANYPQEVQDLFHSPDADFGQLTSWFMNSARCGEVAARMYASFYLLLLKADPKGGEDTVSAKDQKPAKKITGRKVKLEAKAEANHKPQDRNTEAVVATPDINARHRILNTAPELHINIQLHLSPESTADQIDKIFESMAKHLKDFAK